MIDIPEFLEIFRTFLTKEMLKNMVIVICLNFEEPWDFMDQLDEWIKKTVAAISPTLGELSLEENDEMRNNLRKFVLRFADPIENEQKNFEK
jgi:Dynein light intermediate chain (DLIC)